MNNQDTIFDVIIIGGGIVGAATMFRIAEAFPNKSILMIEKEKALADHQTGNNSGVIHSGLYYKPGSLKAKNCTQGRVELEEFCQHYGVAHEICGKVVVAVDKSELPQMEKVYQTGLQNGLSAIEKIGPEQVKEIEPHVESLGAIWVPYTGIVDYRGATEKMVEVALSKNASSKLKLEETVQFTKSDTTICEVVTNKAKYKGSKLIFCAGLQADRLARKDGINLKEQVVGFRGDYYVLTDEAKHKVKNLIYPIPNPDFPFLGVHFTRMTNGEIECGPNAVFTFKREGYSKTDFSFRDTYDALTYAGTWKLFLGNISFGINEYRRAFSKKLFLKTLQRIIPSLTMHDIEPGRAGVRALLLGKDGDTRDDFRIEYKNNSIHVLNAPSPAATASLAIGSQIRDMAIKQFNW
jgi:L-2-hydroxyglutarate oxidase